MAVFRKTIWARVALLSMTTLASLSAHGQAEKDSAANADTLESVVVTAQKRVENLQSVPISVTAVSGDKVEELHATNLQGLQGTVPNIQINTFTNTPNNAVITIRGIGVIEPDPFAGNTVSIVQDGVPQYFSMGALLDLFDVDRIEVLRGPQGTLFGANTTGGVVNVVTRQPTGEFGGRGEVTAGNWNRLDVKGAVDFPIMDGVLAGKVAALHTGRKGWVTNIIDGTDMGRRDVNVVRGYLKYTPTSDLNVTFLGEYGMTRNGAPIVVNASYPGDLIFVPAGVTNPGQRYPMYQSPCPSPTQPCTAPDHYYAAADHIPDRSDMDTYRGTLTANWLNTAVGDITSITGYKHFVLEEWTDDDAVYGLGIDTWRRTKGWQLSQELRSSIKVNDAVNLLVGGFYMKTNYDHFMDLRLQFAAPGLRQLNPQNQDNWSGSLFAQGFINFTDRLRFQAGIRFTEEQTKMVAGVYNFINLTGPAVFYGDTPLGGFSASGEKKWNKLGWKLGLDYKITDDTLLYGYYARGFKSGGFVGRLATPKDIGPFNPETVDTFEVGVKTDLADHRLRVNLATFYTLYKEMQVEENYILPDGKTIGTSIFNAAKSNIKGAELEVTALPVSGLTLTGSIAYLDAKYKTFQFFDQQSKTFLDLSGYSLQNSPKVSATAGATYKFATGPGTTTANALYTYTASKYLQGLTDGPNVKIQPTHYVHANLSWSPNANNWSVELWAHNLLDKHYLEAVTVNVGLFNQAAYAPPREWGATYKYYW